MTGERRLNREKKRRAIDELVEIISKCSAAVFTDYRGLSTAEMTRLRRRMRESGVQYRVVKNTLARFAAEEAGREPLARFFDGPVAMAFSYDEAAEAARALVDYIKDSKSELDIRGGFIGDRLLTKAEVSTLARLPSRDILLARILAGMQAPVTGLVGVLSGPMRGLVTVIGARIKQLEGE